MEYKKILKNITGISTPFFGIQWNPPVVESDVAREIILFSKIGESCMAQRSKRDRVTVASQ